ncbi:MAG TPA: lanthionine synthetase LanC family protein, partial [Isosphaeraceae bacterium]|nr:lanthionine synthetase LanC family protein [Isosphaeraceae bacterium]
MSGLHQDLLAILDAVEIVSPRRYALLGQWREVPGSNPAGLPPAAVSHPLVSALAVDLYERLYIRPSSSGARSTRGLARRDLVAGLSAANSGRGTWEPGWTVRRIEENGQVVVSAPAGPTSEVAFWVSAADVRVRDGPVRPGVKCRVWVAKELRGLLPGFYVALGDGQGDSPDDGDEFEDLGRYYWHLMAEAAVPFLARATMLLNEARIPFRIKVCSDVNGYRRADAGVLFFRRRDRARLDPLVARIHSAVAAGLRPDVPLFTQRLADGLGFAEHPIGSGSFGAERCRLVAGSLWQSFIRAEVDRDSRGARLASAFLEAGLNPLRPYLGPDWRAEGDSTPWTTTPALALRAGIPEGDGTARNGSAVPARTSPLETAVRIGWALCQSAWWDQGGQLCNWVGRSTGEIAEEDGPTTPTAAALGPDLYGGSAGIALFLAQLHAMTGDCEFRRTALGAIARSIRRLECSPPRPPLSPLSFFSGSLGIAYAAWRTANRTGHAELSARVESILDQVVAAASAPHLLDVIGGNAGAIPVLLAMSREHGLERCRDLAIALGDELCRAEVARPDVGAGLASGLAHGAAGIGWALFELHAATGRPDFRDAARRCLDREDALFDPQAGNWAEARPGSGAPPRFGRAWCHGAPGIALTRLRAAALDPDR